MPQLPPPPPEMKSARTWNGRGTLETFRGAWQTVLWEGHDGGGRRVTASWGHSGSSDSNNASCNTIHTGREGEAWDVRGGQVCGRRWQGACDGEPQGGGSEPEGNPTAGRTCVRPASTQEPSLLAGAGVSLVVGLAEEVGAPVGSFLPAPGRGPRLHPLRLPFPILPRVG